MITTSRLWRLFLFVSSVTLSLLPLWAQSPTLTTVADTVLRADGAPAAGTLLISWPAFTTSDGRAVAPGSKSVVLASDGSFSVDLAQSTPENRPESQAGC